MSEERTGDLKLSLGFAFIGGYADAASFVLAQTFTGHVTGNLVLATVSLANADWLTTLRRLGAVVCFLVGSILGIVLQKSVTKNSSWLALRIAVAGEIAFVAFAYLAMISQASARAELLVCALCMALGLQNGAWQQVSGIGIHTTYLTGTITTLVTRKLAQFRSSVHQRREAEGNSSVNILSALCVTFLVGSVIGACAALHYRAAAVLGVVPPLLAILLSRPSVGK